jgi:glucoamylase
VQTTRAAVVHWSRDGWTTTQDTPSRAGSALGIEYADLDTAALPLHGTIEFTLYYPEEQRWEGQDYRVTITT